MDRRPLCPVGELRKPLPGALCVLTEGSLQLLKNSFQLGGLWGGRSLGAKFFDPIFQSHERNSKGNGLDFLRRPIEAGPHQAEGAPGKQLAARIGRGNTGMALDYLVHQVNQSVRGYDQGGLGAFEHLFHWGKPFSL